MSALATTDARAGDGLGANGLVQRIDPRVRLVLAAAFALVAVGLRSSTLLVLMLAAAAVLAGLARLPPGPTLRRMLGLDAFMVPILLFLPFTVPGAPIASIGPLAITAEGIRQALQIVLTANAVVLCVSALVGTLEPATLGHALLGLRVPEKLARMLLLTVRYVAVLREEYDRLRLAMRARAFRAAGNAHTWRSYGYLFGMLLVRSFERSERILDAMKCRGFVGRWFTTEPRTLRAIDWAFAGALTAVLLAIGGCGAAGMAAG